MSDIQHYSTEELEAELERRQNEGRWLEYLRVVVPFGEGLLTIENIDGEVVSDEIWNALRNEFRYFVLEFNYHTKTKEIVIVDIAVRY